MNRPLDVARALLAVDLAREPEFTIGSLRVCPSQLQIMVAGRQETVQPRVMQVLVALARAKGAVISREQLIDSCWDGVVVGDDAINRSIAKVRQIAEFGGGHFEIETIPRVGYRLIVSEAAAEQVSRAANAPSGALGPAAEASFPLSDPRSRTLLIGAVGAAVALAALAAILVARAWGPTPKDIAIAVNAAGAPVQGSFAAALQNVANAHGGLAFSDGPGNGAGDFVLNVSLQRAGSSTHADVALTRVGSKDLLWSSSLEASDADLLRRRVAYAAFRALGCATEASSDVRNLEGGGLRRLFSACDRTDTDDPDELTIELWQKVVQADPDNARALAMLGFLEAGSADASEPDSPPVLARRRMARNHLQKALAADAGIGIAYAAEEALLPRWHYQERLDLLDRGIARDPTCALLHDRKAQFWTDIGKVERAISSVRRAVDLNPASTLFRDDLIAALAGAGYTATAAAELKNAERIWPDSRMIGDARARFDFRFGDPDRLLRAMDNGTAIPNVPTPWAYHLRDILVARAQPTRANTSAAIADALRLAQNDGPYEPLQNLVFLGAIDQAYEVMKNPVAVADLRQGGTYVLFRAFMRPFLLDRRFPDLAAKLGLLQFWESSDLWPNFCDDKQLPYHCEQEARRLHSLASSRGS